jgi:virulence factor Mce-like protein
MRRLVSVGFVLLLCAGAAVFAGAKDDGATGKTYEIVFDNAFGLVEGGDFRVGGVNAGQTTEFEATKDTPPKARVTAKVSEPGLDNFRTDATCSIKPQSLIGEYYVDCQHGKARKKLDDGGTVPVTQTSSTIAADLVNNILRRPYRERLRLIINELGTGLAGRPKDLQQVLKRAHPGLRETTQVLRVLGDQSRVIEGFIRDADTVVAELENRKEEVSRFIVEAGETAEIAASRREALRQTFRKLPGFLDQLTPTMARLEDVADEQIPLLRDAREAAPSLDTFLARLGPFAEASRPAVRALGRASLVGTRAFEKGSNEVKELRQLAAEAPATAKPLRQFLESLDDRRRATDDDPRGTVGSPPANDPSNRGKRSGFTGSESFWNYFFWQSMALNGFDNVSHLLRVSAVISECSEYFNETPLHDPDPAVQEHIDECNQYLGPRQPGINAPDFTQGAAARSLARRSGRAAKRVGERRAAGQPDAGPLPGQKDVSKPQVALPPDLQKLVDRLPRLPKTGVEKLDDVLGGGGPGGQGGAPPAANELLDYLLAP